MSSSDDTDGPQDPRDQQAAGPGGTGSGAPGPAPEGGPDGGHDAGSSKGRRTGLAVGGGVAGIVVVLAVVFGSLYATDTAPFGGSSGDSEGSDAAIASVTRDYVNAAMNTQKVDDVLPTLCSADAERLSELKDGPGNPNKIRVDDISDIRIQGDIAAAKVTISGDVDGERKQETATVPFKKEDGDWKVCPSTGATGGSPAPGAASQGGGAPQGGAPQPGGAAPQGGAPQGSASQGGGATQGGGASQGGSQSGD